MCAFKNILYDIKIVFLDGQVIFIRDVMSCDIASRINDFLLSSKKIEIKLLKKENF